MPRESASALLPRLHEWRGAGLSVQGVRERPQDYAVVSRAGDGPTSSGRLELGDDDLVLHGSSEPDGLRIPLDELAWSKKLDAERLNGSTATSR